VAQKHRREHGLASDEPTPFDGVTFHDLRRTCASLMIAAANHAGAGQAVTVKSIAEQLAHSDGGVLVLRRYGHLFKATRRRCARRVRGRRPRRPAATAPAVCLWRRAWRRLSASWASESDHSRDGLTNRRTRCLTNEHEITALLSRLTSLSWSRREPGSPETA
jgi:hypothetical protein